MSSTIEMTDMEDDHLTWYARAQIWYQYAGPYTMRTCLYPWCQRMMSQENFCVVYYDYLTAWSMTSIHNMRPVCEVCYMNMRKPTMREWVDHMDYEYSMGANPIPPRGDTSQTHTPLQGDETTHTPLQGDGTTHTLLQGEERSSTPFQGDGTTYAHPVIETDASMET